MLPEPVRPAELPAAFRMLFHGLPANVREERVSYALSLVRKGELDVRGLFGLRRQMSLVGVILAAVLPGAGGLIRVPVVQRGPSAKADENTLVAHATGWLRGQGAKLAQALVSPEELGMLAPLLRNGFRNVTNLLYLGRELTQPVVSPQRLTYEPYDPLHPQEFHATLERTYIGTLDCPEVNGVRTAAEVIAGHQGQGRFDPALWWLARRDGQAVGVLLLLGLEAGEWEVAYTGVVPEARRGGIGRELLLRAMHTARGAGVQSLVLCVDERNTPARELYRSVGFAQRDARTVVLSVLHALTSA